MSNQDLIDLGFKITRDYSTYYIGGYTFLHAQVNEDGIAFLWYGDSIERDNCMPMWHAPRTIETLKKLLEGLTGINYENRNRNHYS